VLIVCEAEREGVVGWESHYSSVLRSRSDARSKKTQTLFWIASRNPRSEENKSIAV